MAVYRFRVAFEDYDDVVREIDIKSNQTFEDFHRIIHKSTGYNAESSSSFYVSNDQWMKGEEIAYLPSQRKIDRGVSLMEKVKLGTCIDDPHQKFYYTFNFDRPYDFHIELMKIILNDAPDTTYPVIIRSTGEAPKQPGSITVTPTETTKEGADDFDFLNEMEFSPEDTSDLEEMSDVEESGSERETEEDDEFNDEFSDNESYESDESSSRDDY